MIYGYVLGFKNPVSTRVARHLSFYSRHLRECPVRKHHKRHLTITCTSHFDANDVQTYEPPPSVLEFLLVSKVVKQEALPLVFENNFILDAATVRWPLPVDCNARFEMIQDVTFLWSTYKILKIMKALYRLPRLRNLSLIVNFWPDDRPWRMRNKSLSKTRGFEELSHLRGLKKVELAGKDLIRRAGGRWEEIDINDPAAIGPRLRFMLMLPKPPGYEEDMKFHMEALGGLYAVFCVQYNWLMHLRYEMMTVVR